MLHCLPILGVSHTGFQQSCRRALVGEFGEYDPYSLLVADSLREAQVVGAPLHTPPQGCECPTFRCFSWRANHSGLPTITRFTLSFSLSQHQNSTPWSRHLFKRDKGFTVRHKKEWMMRLRCCRQQSSCLCVQGLGLQPQNSKD